VAEKEKIIKAVVLASN